MSTTYVTLAQGAKHFNVSLSTFRGWVRSGTVPKDTYISFGSVLRFDLAAVEKALRNNAGGKNETTGDKK